MVARNTGKTTLKQVRKTVSKTVSETVRRKRNRNRLTLQRGQSITLLTRGAEFFPALCAAIDAAQYEVMMETYIFEMDAVGEQVTSALMQAAQRGVRVSLTLDGFGSAKFPAALRKKMESAGLHFHVYSPQRWYSAFFMRYWRRLHRKLAVIDRQVAFCGGINIVSDNMDEHLGVLAQPRLDFAVRVEGSLVAGVHAAMLKARSFPLQDANSGALRIALKQAAQHLHGDMRAAFIQRDNVRHRRRIEHAYVRAIRAAREEIIIANAYFVPGYQMRHALREAAQRGVKVSLLVQGLYEHFFQFHAGRAVLGSMMQDGVSILLYEASHLHGKVAVIDGKWATVGSSNLDPISLLLAREANIVIDDAVFAQTLRAQLQVAMAEGGKLLSAEEYAKRTWSGRFSDWLAYAVMRLLILFSGNQYK